MLASHPARPGPQSRNQASHPGSQPTQRDSHPSFLPPPAIFCPSPPPPAVFCPSPPLPQTPRVFLALFQSPSRPCSGARSQQKSHTVARAGGDQRPPLSWRAAPRSPTSSIVGNVARAQWNPPALAEPTLIRTSARSAERRRSATLSGSIDHVSQARPTRLWRPWTVWSRCSPCDLSVSRPRRQEASVRRPRCRRRAFLSWPAAAQQPASARVLPALSLPSGAVQGTACCRRSLEVPPPFRRSKALPDVAEILKCRHSSGGARHDLMS